MSSYHFFLSLEGHDYKTVDDRIIQEILNVSVENGNIDCPKDITYDDNESIHYQELKWLLDLIQPHQNKLIEAGVSFEHSSIWMSYVYFNQCNMEFDSFILKQIGELGLKLCISCFNDKNLTARESFSNSLIQSLENGISVSITTGIDEKIEQQFAIRFSIENQRKEDPFIFTILDIDKNFINNFEIIKCDPEPKSINIGNWDTHFQYDSIIQPGNRMNLLIYLKPKTKGVFRGYTRVCEGNQYIEESIIAVID
jgi:hypothetical protein